MKPPGQDSNYVKGSGPVNRRQVLRDKLVEPRVNPLALKRLHKSRALQTLGVPLEQQLLMPRGKERGPGKSGIAMAVLLAVGGVGVLLAAVQASLVMALGGGAALAAAGGVAVLRARREPAAPVSMAGPAFDAESLRKLDIALEQVAPEVGDEVFRQLLALKATLARVAAMLPQVSADENFTVDDRLYLVECVRRYLPDSLEAYLRVPAAQRTSGLLESGKSARAVLQDQLVMLQSELEKREGKLGRSAAEGLMRQQRFLESKAKTR